MVALTRRLRVRISPVKTPPSPRVKLPICAMSTSIFVCRRRPMRPRCGCQAAGRTARTRPRRGWAGAEAEDGPKPSFLPREEARRAGKKVGDAVARHRKACGKPHVEEAV